MDYCIPDNIDGTIDGEEWGNQVSWADLREQIPANNLSPAYHQAFIEGKMTQAMNRMGISYQ